MNNKTLQSLRLNYYQVKIFFYLKVLVITILFLKY